CRDSSICTQCLPKCIWVAYEQGECSCEEGLVNSTLNIIAMRSGNANCQGFDEMFCGGTLLPSTIPPQINSGNFGTVMVIVLGVISIIVLFLVWLFNNQLAIISAGIRRAIIRRVGYVWRQVRALWNRIHRRGSGRRSSTPRDWRVRYDGEGRDPGTFFRDLVDLNVRMDAGIYPPYQSPQNILSHSIARRPHPPRPIRAPPPPPPTLTTVPPQSPLLAPPAQQMPASPSPPPPTAATPNTPAKTPPPVPLPPPTLSQSPTLPPAVPLPPPTLPPTPPPLPPPAPPMPPPLPPLTSESGCCQRTSFCSHPHL
ncbi:unnamed protein product, partial [Allacma fusca]